MVSPLKVQPPKVFDLVMKAWPLAAIILSFFATLYIGQAKNSAEIDNINNYGSTAVRDFIKVQTEVNSNLIKGQALQNQALEQMNRRIEILERDERERNGK
jgi:hypothetical protein